MFGKFEELERFERLRGLQRLDGSEGFESFGRLDFIGRFARFGWLRGLRRFEIIGRLERFGKFGQRGANVCCGTSSTDRLPFTSGFLQADVDKVMRLNGELDVTMTINGTSSKDDGEIGRAHV